MTGNSRVILLLGASLLVVAFAGMSTVSGSGWALPMATLLAGILFILIFSFMTISDEKGGGSTPVKSVKSQSSESFSETHENLPDPAESGIELPIL